MLSTWLDDDDDDDDDDCWDGCWFGGMSAWVFLECSFIMVLRISGYDLFLYQWVSHHTLQKGANESNIAHYLYGVHNLCQKQENDMISMLLGSIKSNMHTSFWK